MGLNSGGLRPGGLRTATEGLVASDAIPASAIAHYPFLQRSNSTQPDQIGSNDATVTGATNVQNIGKWRKDYAEDGDGSDDRVEIPKEVFNNALSGAEHTVFFTVQHTETSEVRWGQAGGSNNNYSLQFNRDTAGDLRVFHEDGDDNDTDFKIADEGLNDGNPHRVAIAIPSSDTNPPKIAVDGSDVTDSVSSNQANKTSYSYSNNFGVLAEAGGGFEMNGVVDNIIITDKYESDSVISNDYSNQPWS